MDTKKPVNPLNSQKDKILYCSIISRQSPNKPRPMFAGLLGLFYFAKKLSTFLREGTKSSLFAFKK